MPPDRPAGRAENLTTICSTVASCDALHVPQTTRLFLVPRDFERFLAAKLDFMEMKIE